MKTKEVVATQEPVAEPKLLACRDFVMVEEKRVTNEFLEETIDGAVFGGGKIYLHKRTVNDAKRIRIAIWSLDDEE